MAQYRDWNGEELSDGRVAITLIACPAADAAPVPILAAAVTTSDSALIGPDRLGLFLTRHVRRTLIGADVASLHWTLDSILRDPGHEGERESLWQFSRNCRFHDVLLLDALVSVATTDPESGRSLVDLGRRCGRRPLEDIADLALALLTSGAASPAQLSENLVERVVWQAQTILDIYGSLANQAISVAASPGSTAQTIEQYGPLGVGLQVQGAIALERAGRYEFVIDAEMAQHTIAEFEQQRAVHARRITSDSRARQVFRMEAGAIMFDRELPELRSDEALGDWLGGVHGTLTGRYDLPLPRSRLSDGRTALIPEDFGVLCDCHPVLHAWKESLVAGQCLRLVRNAAAAPIRFRYFSVPRISSSPAQATVRRLTDRGLLRSQHDGAFVVGRFADLSLRALAATCRRRDSRSQLADDFCNNVDVVAQLGNRLRETAIRGPRTGTATQPWSDIARSLLTATELKIGPRNSQRLLNQQFCWEVSISDVERLEAVLFDTYPELLQHVEDTAELMARNLGVAASECRNRILADINPVQVRQAVTGQIGDPLILRRLAALNQKLFLHGRLATEVGSLKLYDEIFGERPSTSTGRVRRRSLFAEGNAEHLDLADDATKAALYAVAAGGHFLAGYAKRVVAVAFADRSAAECAATELTDLIEAAAQRVLGGIPVVCSCAVRTAW